MGEVAERKDYRNASLEAIAKLEEALRETRLALARILNCIDTSAADSGPPVTRGSAMAQVCKVLQMTGQYTEAKYVLTKYTPVKP